MREPLDIDDLEFRGRSPQEHRQVADLLLGWATERHPDDDPEVTPAELLSRAGEHLSMAGDHDAALDVFRRALTADGPSTMDVRCHVHHELLAMGTSTALAMWPRTSAGQSRRNRRPTSGSERTTN